MCQFVWCGALSPQQHIILRNGPCKSGNFPDVQKIFIGLSFRVLKKIMTCKILDVSVSPNPRNKSWKWVLSTKWPFSTCHAFLVISRAQSIESSRIRVQSIAKELGYPLMCRMINFPHTLQNYRRKTQKFTIFGSTKKSVFRLFLELEVKNLRACTGVR